LPSSLSGVQSCLKDGLAQSQQQQHKQCSNKQGDVLVPGLGLCVGHLQGWFGYAQPKPPQQAYSIPQCSLPLLGVGQSCAHKAQAIVCGSHVQGLWCSIGSASVVLFVW
jgi:hypothetical protein